MHGDYPSLEKRTKTDNELNEAEKILKIKKSSEFN